MALTAATRLGPYEVTARLARFQREAEVLAPLNHPHIAALYGLERSVAASFLKREHSPGVCNAIGSMSAWSAAGLPTTSVE